VAHEGHSVGRYCPSEVGGVYTVADPVLTRQVI
jgi:hypothetical protein